MEKGFHLPDFYQSGFGSCILFDPSGWELKGVEELTIDLPQLLSVPDRVRGETKGLGK